MVILAFGIWLGGRTIGDAMVPSSCIVQNRVLNYRLYVANSMGVGVGLTKSLTGCGFATIVRVTGALISLISPHCSTVSCFLCVIIIVRDASFELRLRTASSQFKAFASWHSVEIFAIQTSRRPEVRVPDPTRGSDEAPSSF